MSGPEIAVSKLAGRVLAPPGANVVLAEWTAQGSTDPEPRYQAPLHRHAEDEAWYVLDGTLCVRVGDEDLEISAGGAAVVPGGLAHTYWNPTAAPARYLLVMGIRTYGLVEALHASGVLGPEQMRRLFQDHGAELLQ